MLITKSEGRLSSSYRRQTVLGNQPDHALASVATLVRILTYAVVTVLTAFAPDLALGQVAGASKPKPQMKLKNGDSQYKRIHQFALRMIELEKPEVARKTLEDHLGRHPNDEESLFLMGVLNATSGNNVQAVKNWKQALEANLPPGRIVAGPRGVLSDIQDHDFVKSLRTELAQTLIHGPILGSVTDASAMAWVRTADETQVRLVVSESPNFTVAIAGKATMALAKNDFTAKPVVEGLKPSTRYFYAIEIDGNLNRSDDQVFSTFPGPGRSSQFKLAFGGGAGYVPPNERMWNVIAKQQPDLALLLGDNVYIDDPESEAMQKYTYYRRQSRPEFRAFTAKTPTFTIWDDHDFGTNDCWGGPEIDRPAWKRDKAWTIYRQNWPNPGFGGGEEQPGCWYTFSYGDVDFVMLDCRYYRTSPRVESPSMLGPAQIEWFKKVIPSLQGKFKVICSSVPWTFASKGDSLDMWNGYKAERNMIFDFLREKQIEGVVLVSADRHRSDAWKLSHPGGYDFYEFNSSRLTNQHVHKEMAQAIFSYNKQQSFGLVSFDTTADNPTVKYEVINISGETVHEMTLKLSQLSL